LGYTKNNLKFLIFDDITEYKSKKEYENMKNKKITRQKTTFVTKANKKIPVELKMNNFKLNNEEVILIIARDITTWLERERELKEQKEELNASYEQLTAYNEEITAMNEELDEALLELNNLNERFIDMISIVSSLNKKNDLIKKDNFLSRLLHTAIKIVPEADYGKICVVEKNDKCRFIETVGHNLSKLQSMKIHKEIFLHNNDKDVYKSDGYSFDISRIPQSIKQEYISVYHRYGRGKLCKL
jgi:hypothetical protein